MLDRVIFITQCNYRLRQVVQFTPIADGSPMIVAFWKELNIIFKRIMTRIEEIFAV